MPLTRAVSVMDPPYGARGIGRSWDDTDAFRRALEDHESVHCPRPPVGYSINWSGEIVHGLKVCVPIGPGRKLSGDRATILTNLPDRTLHPSVEPDAARDHSAPNSVSWFYVQEGADDVELDGLDFVGDAPRVTPENHELNLWMAAIEAAWGPKAPNGLKVRHCGFFHQWGFPIHQRAGGTGYRVMHCTLRDCMNGVNNNSDDGFYLDNDHERTEGFELSGSRLQILFNRFRDAYWAGIAYGGHTGPGVPENRSYDSVLLGNTVDGSYRHGINVSTNTERTLVAESRITRTRHHGFIGGGGGDGTNQPRALTVDRMELVDCGGPNENVAVYLVDVLGAVLSRVVARYGETPGHHQNYGLFIRGGRDVVVDDTNAFSGQLADVYIAGGERITLPRTWRRPTRVIVEPR